MSVNRAKYFQEKFDSFLYRMGMDSERQKSFIDKLIAHTSNVQVPPSFFDVEGTINIYASQSRLPLEKARERIADNPLVILDIHNIPYTKLPCANNKAAQNSAEEVLKPASRMPSDLIIARAAHIMKQKTGTFPRGTGNDELPEWSYGWRSIGAKLNERGVTFKQLVEQHKDKLPKKKIIMLEQIADSARRAVEATGHRPTAADDKIEYGALKGKYSWASVNRALERGTHGLHKLSYKSLAECLDALDVPKTYEPANKKNLDHGDIIESARLMLQDPLFLRRPNAADGEILHGPLAGKTTWNSVHQILVRAAKADASAPVSLSALLASANVPKKATLSVQDVFLECAGYAKERPQGFVSELGPYVKPLATMDKVLREGKVEGVEDIAKKPVTGIIDFMLATGLLERRGGEIFAAPLPRIDHLCKTFA